MVMNVRTFTMGPHLDAAVMMIALDNGLINRLESADDVRAKVRGAIASHFTDAELATVEEELSLLHPGELQTLCIGEQGAVAYLTATELTKRVLDIAYDAMV